MLVSAAGLELHGADFDSRTRGGDKSRYEFVGFFNESGGNGAEMLFDSSSRGTGDIAGDTGPGPLRGGVT